MQRFLRSKSDPSQSPLDLYLREINDTPLLSHKEEKELAYRVGKGDWEARDHLVRANLRLVVNIACNYSGKGLGFLDLIAEGNLGLLRAVEGFDPSRNIRFCTYASFWIKQSIKRGLVNKAKIIRIPAHMIELMSKWRRASTKLHEELGRTPTEQEIARRLELPKKQLNNIRKAFRVYNSVPQSDQPDSGPALDELLMDNRAKTPDTQMTETDDRDQVLELLNKMDDREATVLRMRFGLDDEEPKTLHEIGEHLGLTRERVRQIESAALSHLRWGFWRLDESTRQFSGLAERSSSRTSPRT